METALATLPAERRDAAALALEARAPATRRAYRAALARLNEWLAGRPLTDATLAAHIADLAHAGLAPAYCFRLPCGARKPPRSNGAT